MISWGNGIGSNMELVCERNPNKKVLKKKTQLTVMKNLPCMYTNPDTLTNKMPELKDVIHHNPWIIAVTQIQGSHSDWKTWKTWKNGKAFSSQGKVREF